MSNELVHVWANEFDTDNSPQLAVVMQIPNRLCQNMNWG